jgi:hypothetical protein
MIEHRPTPKAPAPRTCFEYVRMERVPLGATGPLSGPPLTWTLSEVHRKDHRVIVYVTLDNWRVDGWSRALARKRYRDSVVVDAHSLGPLPRTRRRPALTREQREFVQHWRNYYRATWEQMLAKQAPCELLARTWWERCFHRPIFARHVMLRSELNINWFLRDNGRRFDYVIEGTFKPTIPNQIGMHSLGDGKREIVAFAEIAPVVQADAALSDWVQRCWWIDHSRSPAFGAEPIDDGDYSRCVVPRSVRSGLVSEPFDPRNVRPYPLDYIRRGACDHSQKEFLSHYERKP